MSHLTEEQRYAISIMQSHNFSQTTIATTIGKDKSVVSRERIYQHVWADKKRGGDLYTHLRKKGRKYR